jgi:hypothetical protein
LEAVFDPQTIHEGPVRSVLQNFRMKVGL